jgi:hypothetical protein
VRAFRHSLRGASVFIATLALVLNVVLGAFCACHAGEPDNRPANYSHSGDHHADGKNHIPAGQPDDDDLCCKCCGTIALNFSGAPPSLPVPVLVEWRKDSPVLAEMESNGAIKIAGAMYNLETGVVDFFAG